MKVQSITREKRQQTRDVGSNPTETPKNLMVSWSSGMALGVRLIVSGWEIERIQNATLKIALTGRFAGTRAAL